MNANRPPPIQKLRAEGLMSVPVDARLLPRPMEVEPVDGSLGRLDHKRLGKVVATDTDNN
jgi:hypothetical protein